MEIIFLGTGNAFSESGDRPACHLIRSDTFNLMLDCGPSVLPALYQNNIQPVEIDAVYISHLHPDHYMGLLYLFLDDFYVSRRGVPLKIYCPPGTKQKVTELGRIMYKEATVANLLNCYEFHELERTSSAVVSPEIALETIPAVHMAHGRIGIFTFPEFVLTYSGDTEYDSELMDKLVARSDFILHEATSAELQIPGHTNLYELLDTDIPSDTYLFITHHDQSVIDILEPVQLPENIILVRDNDRINLVNLLKNSELNLDI